MGWAGPTAIVAVALAAAAGVTAPPAAAASHDRDCRVAALPAFGTTARLSIEVARGHFCLHRFDVGAFVRHTVRVTANPAAGHAVGNGSDLWGYRAPEVSGRDRFTVAVAGTLPDGRPVRTTVVYEVTVR